MKQVGLAGHAEFCISSKENQLDQIQGGSSLRETASALPSQSRDALSLSFERRMWLPCHPKVQSGPLGHSPPLLLATCASQPHFPPTFRGKLQRGPSEAAAHWFNTYLRILCSLCSTGVIPTGFLATAGAQTNTSRIF